MFATPALHKNACHSDRMCYTRQTRVLASKVHLPNTVCYSGIAALDQMLLYLQAGKNTLVPSTAVNDFPHEVKRLAGLSEKL